MPAHPDFIRSHVHHAQPSPRPVLSETGKRRLCLLLRIGLGLLILASGVGKALDIDGFAAVLATYELGLSTQALLPLASVVCVVELGLGIWLLGGVAVRAAAIAAAMLNFAYFVLLGTALLRGLDLPNCGCFGVYLARPLRWYSPLEDLLLIGACTALLHLRPKHQWSTRPSAG